MKKPGTLVKTAAGGVAALGVYLVSGAVGNATQIPAGWKRGAIGAVATAVVAGGASALKQTKALVTPIAVGGIAGALALLFEPQLKSFMAERRAMAGALPAPPPTIGAPPPPPAPPYIPPPTPPPPPRPPTTEELIFGLLGTGLGVLGTAFAGSGAYAEDCGDGMDSNMDYGAGLTYDYPFGAGARMGAYEAARN